MSGTALLALAGLGMAWVWLVAPAFIEGESLAAAGKQIAEGGNFSLEILEPLVAAERPFVLNSPCIGPALQGKQWIALKLADLADQEGNNVTRIDANLEQLERNVRTTLACSPYDGFAWLMLYWAHGRRTGFNGEPLDFLAMSYAVAPREGALALYRNPKAILAFGLLPPALQALVVDEWRLLVQARAYETAAAGLTQIDEDGRERLLAQRDGIDAIVWAEFALYLYRKGSDLVLPDTKQPQRPWR